MRRRTLSIAALTSALVVLTAAVSQADFAGGADKDKITLTALQLRGYSTELSTMQAKGGPHWDYRSHVASCDVGGAGSWGYCYAQAVSACASLPPAEGKGPLTEVWRRMVDEKGASLPTTDPAAGPGGWIYLGATCLPSGVPGVAPMPTVEMIVEAFHRTSWAKASISTQPKGDTTLVGLKTFYRAQWSGQGYEPGEIDSIDPATMFGFNVQIRPRLESFVYHFGDGSSFGPTTSTGGVYPSGDVIHAYPRPGKYPANVDVTFGAQFRINGGAWVDIPDTVTVRQPATTVTVREAKGVLVNH